MPPVAAPQDRILGFDQLEQGAQGMRHHASSDVVSPLFALFSIRLQAVLPQQLVQRERRPLHVLHLAPFDRPGDAQELELGGGAREPRLQFPQSAPLQRKRLRVVFRLFFVSGVRSCSSPAPRPSSPSEARAPFRARPPPRARPFRNAFPAPLAFVVALALASGPPEPATRASRKRRGTTVHVGGVARVLQQRVRGAAVGQRRPRAPGRGIRTAERLRVRHLLLEREPRRRLHGPRRRDVDVTQKSAEPGSEHGGRDHRVRARHRAQTHTRAARAVDDRDAADVCFGPVASSGFASPPIARLASLDPRETFCVSSFVSRRSRRRRSPVIRGRLRRASLARLLVRVRLSRGSVEEIAILVFGAVLAAPPLAARRRRQLQRARALWPARRRATSAAATARAPSGLVSVSCAAAASSSRALGRGIVGVAAPDPRVGARARTPARPPPRAPPPAAMPLAPLISGRALAVLRAAAASAAGALSVAFVPV